MTDLFGYSHYERLTRSAEISDCGKYRYWLRRTWQAGGNGKTCTFIMLNPSTADAMIDDPTIRRCMKFVQDWGYSTLSVRNLFSYRATDPDELEKVEDPVGPQGDMNILAAHNTDLLIVAWGAFVPAKRDKRVLELLAGKELHCLGTTKAGQPRHPLYVKGDQQPVLFVPRTEKATV